MSQQLKWRLRVISRSMCCAKNEPAAGTVPLGGQVVEFFLAVMSDASCQDLQAISVISGGGVTECIHGSVRCLAAKVTGRGCHLPLDPLHVQISKVQTAIGREENTVETCSEQVYRSQEALTKAQDHLWEIQGRLEQVALRKEEEDQGYVAMALQDGPGSWWDADSPGSNDVEGHDTPAEAECVCCRLWLCCI